MKERKWWWEAEWCESELDRRAKKEETGEWTARFPGVYTTGKTNEGGKNCESQNFINESAQRALQCAVGGGRQICPTPTQQLSASRLAPHGCFAPFMRQWHMYRQGFTEWPPVVDSCYLPVVNMYRRENNTQPGNHKFRRKKHLQLQYHTRFE